MNWPASRGTVTALLPDLVAMNLELSACAVTPGHIALTFRYSDTVSNYSLVVVLDAIPEQKFDQAFQIDLIKALCSPPSSELRSNHETFRSANTDMLISRHESPVTHVAFLRSRVGHNVNQPQKVHPLRCVITREDGGAYVWEWGHEKFDWTFLNSFNVANELDGSGAPSPRITTMDSFAAGAAFHGLAFHDKGSSATSSKGGAVVARLVSFETTPTLAKHPTHIIVGSVVPMLLPPPSSVRWMQGSHVGLWMVTNDNHIYLRSSTSPMTLHTSWGVSQNPADKVEEGAVNSVTETPPELLFRCIHSTTGALVTLHPHTGQVWTCQARDGGLVITPCAYRLALPQDPTDRIRHLASHRQFLFVLTTHACIVYDVHSGTEAARVTAPDAAASFWTSGPGGAVGLWSWNGLWRLTVPSAKQYAHSVACDDVTQSPAAALRHLQDFGPNLQFDQAAMALQVLRHPPTASKAAHTAAKLVFEAAAESPAWLLALVADHAVPSALEADLYNLLNQLSAATTSTTQSTSTSHHVRTTPVNLESIDHLRAWLDVRQRRAAIIQDLSYLTPSTTTAAVTYPSSLAASQELLRMSALHLASLVAALPHGRNLLSQLESVLLLNQHDRPSHVLFHDERVTAGESLRHPAYFESVVRLTFQHRPAAFGALVRSIASACPRVLTLRGVIRLVRPHADRALAAVPPLRLHLLLQPASVNAAVLAYTDALVASRAYMEALQMLLRFQLYARAKLMFAELPPAVQPTWFWHLVEHVACHLDVLPMDELAAVVALKPSHIPNASVLAALHRAMPPKKVSVQMLRPVLHTLVA
ncbi:hypothetical protein DYB36_006946 [Aphanomyces astaci]|uniref:Mic1 domain-containing protein n=1 Tax=Aphanomyces astaci TaxID=112090 RepID=A0A396ZYW1_APHAT|nr:hypothetical protein DYB36_006946 [Aphanomyces astaci]